MPGACNTILYYTILYYTILYYTILYYTILYYTILYYTILYYAILYYTINKHPLRRLATTGLAWVGMSCAETLTIPQFSTIESSPAAPWTPKVCKLLAVWAAFVVLGLILHTFGVCGFNSLSSHLTIFADFTGSVGWFGLLRLRAHAATALQSEAKKPYP